MERIIALDFGDFILEAALFDTSIARQFAAHLPYTVQLEQWGQELYGTIGRNFGKENPVDDIPPGSIAYTPKGKHICIFFGQKPAWAVEYIGHILDEQWERLVTHPEQDMVFITLK